MVKECTKVIYEEKVRKKESISKQGRKNAKSKPTLDAFDDLDADLAHGMDYMETEEAVNEGMQSNETEELNLDVDTEVIAKDKGSGEKGGSIVSTARPKVDTARPDIDTARLEVHTTNALVSTAGVTISTADPKVSAVEPRTPPTTTSIFDDEDITMAQTLIKMKEEKSKEKGVAFKDVEDSSRPVRSITTLKPLPYIDPKDKGKGILNMGGYKHSQLEAKKFEEIQAMYERKKKKIDDFKPMDSDDAVKDRESSEKVLDVSKKRKGGPRMKRMSKRKKTESDLEEEEDLKTFLKIVPDKEGIINYEVLEKRFPIINWESKFYHYDRHRAEGIYYRIFRSDGSSRWIKTFSEMVTRFDRLDLVELYNLVMQRFETITPEGVDLVLWGDLRTMVHTLTLEDGTEIHMLAERKYPLTKETLEMMMSLKLIVESTSDGTYDLLRFIQKHIDEAGSYDGEQTASGKDFSNPLMADSLPKTIWIISLEREINPRNPQHAFKRCEACGSSTHTTTDHYDIEWFKRGEALQAKKAEALKSTRAESSNANRSKTPTKSGCSRHMTGVKSYLHKYVEQPGPKVVFGDDSTCTTEGYGSIKCNGIVFTKHLVNFCDEKRISQNFSSPYTPEQNGVAERKNRTLIEAARTMLSGSVFSKQYWTEVVATACYTQNRSTIVKIHLKTPYEIFHKRIPNINFLHVFGCSVYIHNHKDHRGKFDEKADDGYLLGYSLVSKAFRVFNTRRHNVSFKEPYKCPEPVVLETEVSSDQNGQTDQNDQSISKHSSSLKVEDILVQDTIPILNPPLPIPSVVTLAPQDRWSQEKHIELVNIIGNPGAGMLTRAMSKELNVASAHECLFVDFLSEEEPKKVSEALKHPRWVDAMQDELNQFAKNKVWTLVPTSYGKTIIGSKWVFKNKRDETGIVIKNKARLVAQGYN
ncbi:retrovirus-related pol polyprotein from transposon TNT 1-94 [Tanacetum coccineum]